MIIVSDTSPLINLAAVGQLDLLRQLYQHVILPQAIYDEVVIAGAGQPGAVEVKTAIWIETRHVHDQALANVLLLELDRGEAEALALATELKADLLLIDESKGRAIAARLGLTHIGLLGVLVLAKQRGIIVAVKPILDDLIAKAGFWIGGDLYQRVLQAVSE
jgi:predicted nucleic acid-binding protein